MVTHDFYFVTVKQKITGVSIRNNLFTSREKERVTVFVENQFKPLRANNMKQFNESIFKSSLLRSSAKNGERHSFSSLVSYATMSLFRLLLSAHDYHTFIHFLVVLTVFLFTAFSASFCIPPPELSGNLGAIF